MPYSLCLLAAVPLRKEPAHRSEMVSQLTFGEFAEVLEETSGFTKVRCHHDGYEGWVQNGQLQSAKSVLDPIGYSAAWQHPALVKGIAAHVPFGAPLYESTALQETTGVAVEHQPSEVLPLVRTFGEAELKPLYEPFLGSPYLWGGRSVYGIDCSGFVQQVFKHFGLNLKRDAYLQAEQGKEVSSIDNVQAGDLAFFHNEAGRVTHVGLMLAADRIVHASVRVRIDVIDAEGIVNGDTGKHSHRLHSIRRFFN